MFTTPQEAKRSLVENLFVEYLKNEKMSLVPGNILACTDTETGVRASFSFYENDNLIEHENLHGKDFVGCVSSSCRAHFQDQHPSIRSLKLEEVSLRPAFSMKKGKRKRGFSALFSINRMVPAQEFFSFNPSVLMSGLECVLKAYEFYVNCDKSHKRLKFLIKNAEDRQRGDLAIKYKYDIARLTEVSWYA